MTAEPMRAWLAQAPPIDDDPEPEALTIEPRVVLPQFVPGRTWAPWQTWNAAAASLGPLHGPRRDLPGGHKEIPWPAGARPKELVYFAAGDHRPPPTGKRLVLTEGEKAADAVQAAGYDAAATVCGAPSDPDDAVIALLAQYNLILSPDNDVDGRSHMDRIACRLQEHGVERLRWLEPLADLPAKWDLADSAPPDRRRLIEAARELPLLLVKPTWRTLADVPDDPPGELLLGMLEPQGPTLAYAAPGTGKGATGSELCVEAQAVGLLPVVFDAERRPREWARRVSGLGGDRSRVVYLEPADLGPKLAGRPFWDQAEAITRIVRAAGGDLFLLDSLLPASGIGEDRLRSDAQAPFLFVAALDSFSIPSLSFGHPPKGQPEGDPFGSMAWLAAFRLTWLGTRAEGDGHRVRWRPKKRNERGHIPGVLMTFTYGSDGRLCAVERADDESSTRDWILAALVHGPRGVPEMAEEVVDELEAAPTGELDRVKERLGKALRRMAREGWVERIGAGHRTTWQLRSR